MLSENYLPNVCAEDAVLCFSCGLSRQRFVSEEHPYLVILIPSTASWHQETHCPCSATSSSPVCTSPRPGARRTGRGAGPERAGVAPLSDDSSCIRRADSALARARAARSSESPASSRTRAAPVGELAPDELAPLPCPTTHRASGAPTRPWRVPGRPACGVSRLFSDGRSQETRRGGAGAGPLGEEDGGDAGAPATPGGEEDGGPGQAGRGPG